MLGWTWKKNVIFFHVSFLIYTKWRFCINENLYFVLPELQKEYNKGADKSSNKYTFGAGILP